MAESESSQSDTEVPTKRFRYDDVNRYYTPNSRKDSYSDAKSEKTSEMSDSSDEDDYNKSIKNNSVLSSSDNESTNGSRHGSQEESEDNLNDSTVDKQTIENNKDSKMNMYSKISNKLMRNMGYIEGKGLGKHQDGRLDPVEPSKQKWKRGLGSKPSTLGHVPKKLKYNPDEEIVKAEESVKFLEDSSNYEVLSLDLLMSWIQEGKKKENIDDEIAFVEPTILSDLLQSKTIFDTLDGYDMRKARSRSNPFETIGSVCFLNRAAVKMANIDAILDFVFTNANVTGGKEQGLLYFVDVCAGPGGFSEYVLFKKHWKAKGIGFTLKDKNDFKLSDFIVGPPDTFSTFYGARDDGNIFKPDNLLSLKEYVMRNTKNAGAHFLMGDGGFSVENKENIQEILSKQLYLCQCLAAIMCVRSGGHFVVKLFDIFTPFSVGLVYLMYKCFNKVSIHKPVTSRPANSERYMICLHKRDDCQSVEQYLTNINKYLDSNSQTDNDITHIVPMSVIRDDSQFFNYIYKSNCIIGKNQITSLLKIAAFCENPSLSEPRQEEMKKKCLQLWKLPESLKRIAEKFTPDQTLDLIMRNCDIRDKDFKIQLSSMGEVLLHSDLLARFGNVFHWNFKLLSSGSNLTLPSSFYLGCGGTSVYELKGSRWIQFDKYTLALPAQTLVYAEIVDELCGEGSGQHRTKALHIIDALCLGGIPIYNKSIMYRQEQCELFCEAIKKEGQSGSITVRCKELHSLENFPNVVESLSVRTKKGRQDVVAVKINEHKENAFYELNSIVFYRILDDPYLAVWSNTNKCVYYVHGQKNIGSFSEIPANGVINSAKTHTGRLLWSWKHPLEVFHNRNIDGLKIDHLNDFILQNLDLIKHKMKKR